MKIYKISQTENTGYDTYDSAIVCAENEDEAKKICPCEYYGYDTSTDRFIWDYKNKNGQKNTEDTPHNWCIRPSEVTVEYLGEAKKELKKGLILGSFNAG